MDLKELTGFIAELALILSSCGAETRLIVQTSERVAKACGCTAVVIVSPNMIIIKLTRGDEEYSSFYRTRGIGLNLGSLIYCSRLCRKLEEKKISPSHLNHILKNFSSWKYSNFLVIPVIGIACGSFCFLNGGNAHAAVTAVLAGCVTIALKLYLNRLGLFHLFVFISCGFTGTLVSFVLGTFVCGLGSTDLAVAMVVSLLPFVPGFPFINGILDLFKGYPVMGIYRLVTTVMLILSVCIGVVLALSLTSLWY